MNNNLFGNIRDGLCSQSKGNKDNNNNAPEEVVATRAATSTTKPGVTAFGPPLTQRVGDKTTGPKHDDKDGEDDGSASPSYRQDASETEKDSENLGSDTPPVDGEPSHTSLKNDNKDSADDGSGSSSYNEDVSETERIVKILAMIHLLLMVNKAMLQLWVFPLKVLMKKKSRKLSGNCIVSSRTVLPN